MFEEWLNKLKGSGSNDKKLTILTLVIIAAIAVIMLSGNWGSNQSAAQVQPAPTEDNQQDLAKLEAAYEDKIASTLEKVDGVGQVTVAVTLSSGPRSEFGVNETRSKTVQEETPTEGGKRTSTQTNDNSQMVLAGSETNGGSQPVKIVELSPQISGVLVVAEGAKNPYVMERIQKSVQTLLGIPATKIRVEPLSKGGGY